MRHLLVAIIILSVAGFVIAGVSLLHNQSLVPGTFCDLSATFDCDVVNKGAFSSIAGIPVALFGVLGYFFLGVVTVMRLRRVDDQGLRLFSLVAATAGLAFTVYLTAIEAIVLRAWCLMCVTSQAIILAIFILTLFSLKKRVV